MPAKRRGRFKLVQQEKQAVIPASEAVSQDEDIVPPSQPQHQVTVMAEIHCESKQQEKSGQSLPDQPDSIQDIQQALTIPAPPALPRTSKSATTSNELSSSPVDIDLVTQSQSQSEPSQSLLHKSCKKRKVPEDTKEPKFVFTDVQEQDIVEWLQEHPILYNKKLREFSTGADKKKELWNDKAKELGCTPRQLIRWWESMRTMYGKLTRTQSGQAAPEHTKRKQWIVNAFTFMQTHIVRVPSRSSKLPGASVSQADGDGEDATGDDDGIEDITDVEDDSDNEDVLLLEDADVDNVASKPTEADKPSTSGLPDLEPVRNNVSSKGKGVGKSSAVKPKNTKVNKTKSISTDTEILKEIAKNMHVMNERRANPPRESKPPTPDELQIKSFCDLISSTMMRVPRHLWSNAIMDCLYTLSRYENFDSGQTMTVPKSPFCPPSARFRTGTNSFNTNFPVPQSSQPVSQMCYPETSNQGQGQNRPLQQQNVPSSTGRVGQFDNTPPGYMSMLSTPASEMSSVSNSSSNDVMSFNEDLYL